MLRHKEFLVWLREFLHVPTIIEASKNILSAHSRTHPLHVVSSNVFAQVSPVQVGECRVGALMVEPSLQDLLHRMANPEQGRAALDNPEARDTAMRLSGICGSLQRPPTGSDVQR